MRSMLEADRYRAEIDIETDKDRLGWKSTGKVAVTLGVAGRTPEEPAIPAVVKDGKVITAEIPAKPSVEIWSAELTGLGQQLGPIITRDATSAVEVRADLVAKLRSIADAIEKFAIGERASSKKKKC